MTVGDHADIAATSSLNSPVHRTGNSHGLELSSIESRCDFGPPCFIGQVPKEKLPDAGLVAGSFLLMRDPVVCASHNPEFRQ